MRLEPLGREHADELWRAAQGADASFAWLRYGPFASQGELLALMMELAGRADQPFWAVRPREAGVGAGLASLCDIYPADGAIESAASGSRPLLQRTRAATEAIFLLMQYAMEQLNYQRLVWRCSVFNQASMKAAARYGFKPEGIWRGAAFSKGRRQDLAWYSIIADEWPERRAAIEAWLADENFDAHGRARSRITHPPTGR